MKTRTILLISLLLLSSRGEAWIAYGFQSGMSRFDIAGHLSDRALVVLSESEQQTSAGTSDQALKYELVYCSSPQKLYLMKFWLVDSRAAFNKTLAKYEKRYGKPEGLDPASADWRSATWADTDIALIWDVNEFETILLIHGNQGTRAEFQDLSVCD